MTWHMYGHWIISTSWGLDFGLYLFWRQSRKAVMNTALGYPSICLLFLFQLW